MSSILGLGAGRCDYCNIGVTAIRWRGSSLCLGCAKQLVAASETPSYQPGLIAADSKEPMATQPPKKEEPYYCATCGGLTGLPAVGMAIYNPDTEVYWPTKMVFCLSCWPKTTFAHQKPVQLA